MSKNPKAVSQGLLREIEKKIYIQKSREKEKINEKGEGKKRKREELSLSSVFPPVRPVQAVMFFPVEMEAAGHQTTRFCWSRKRFR